MLKLFKCVLLKEIHILKALGIGNTETHPPVFPSTQLSGEGGMRTNRRQHNRNISSFASWNPKVICICSHLQRECGSTPLGCWHVTYKCFSLATISTFRTKTWCLKPRASLLAEHRVYVLGEDMLGLSQSGRPIGKAALFLWLVILVFTFWHST